MLAHEHLEELGDALRRFLGVHTTENSFGLSILRMLFEVLSAHEKELFN